MMVDGSEITMEPLDDAIDHVRGSSAGRLITICGGTPTGSGSTPTCSTA